MALKSNANKFFILKLFVDFFLYFKVLFFLQVQRSYPRARQRGIFWETISVVIVSSGYPIVCTLCASQYCKCTLTRMPAVVTSVMTFEPFRRYNLFPRNFRFNFSVRLRWRICNGTITKARRVVIRPKLSESVCPFHFFRPFCVDVSASGTIDKSASRCHSRVVLICVLCFCVDISAARAIDNSASGCHSRKFVRVPFDFLVPSTSTNR